MAQLTAAVSSRGSAPSVPPKPAVQTKEPATQAKKSDTNDKVADTNKSGSTVRKSAFNRKRLGKISFSDNEHEEYLAVYNNYQKGDFVTKGLFEKQVGVRNVNGYSATKFTGESAGPGRNKLKPHHQRDPVRAQIRAWFRAKALALWLNEYDDLKLTVSLGWPVLVHSDGNVEEYDVSCIDRTKILGGTRR